MNNKKIEEKIDKYIDAKIEGIRELAENMYIYLGQIISGIDSVSYINYLKGEIFKDTKEE